PYHNTGLYDLDGAGAYPEPNTGVHSVTKEPRDMGRFRAPSLRNIAVTAPYMHDGSIATLDEVLDHYAAGGRKLSSGPYAGDGSKNRLRARSSEPSSSALRNAGRCSRSWRVSPTNGSSRTPSSPIRGAQRDSPSRSLTRYRP